MPLSLQASVITVQFIVEEGLRNREFRALISGPMEVL